VPSKPKMGFVFDYNSLFPGDDPYKYPDSLHLLNALQKDKRNKVIIACTGRELEHSGNVEQETGVMLMAFSLLINNRNKNQITNYELSVRENAQRVVGLPPEKVLYVGGYKGINDVMAENGFSICLAEYNKPNKKMEFQKIISAVEAHKENFQPRTWIAKVWDSLCYDL
jgi:hypothetical protein